MPIQQWSDEILLAELEPEPAFSEDLAAVSERVDQQPAHVVLNMSRVTQLNSSNISQLLRLRAKLIKADHRLRLCCFTDGVWSVMMVTALDKVFEFAPDVPSALAGLQMREG
jgi:anti-anti-sigma factor